MKDISSINNIATSRPFWKKAGEVKRSSLSLKKVSGTLAQRFPYLNLKGLSEIDDLKITSEPQLLHRRSAELGRSTVFRIESEMDDIRKGCIAFRENSSIGALECNVLSPNLSPSVKGAGATLFTLIILRANSLAEENLALTEVNGHSELMAKKMQAFMPKFMSNEWIQRTDVMLKVPKLDTQELNAVEWYWKYILKVE